MMKASALKTQLTGLMSKPRKGRGYGRLAASDITKSDFCTNRYLFACQEIDENGKELEYADNHNASTQWTFAIGRTFEDFFVENTKHMIFGGWTKGDEYVVGLCPGDGWNYKELRFSNSEEGISGSVDGFLLIKNKLYLIELKTIKHDDWKELEAPLSEHRIRTTFYLDVASKCGNTETIPYPIADKAFIIYATKGFGGKTSRGFSPIKVFDIELNKEIIKPMLQKEKEVLKLKKEGKLSEERFGDYNRQCDVCPYKMKCKSISGER